MKKYKGISEKNIIYKYLKKLNFQKLETFNFENDAAFIKLPKNKKLVITNDTILESVDFFKNDKPESIANKIVTYNLSDISAMGSSPYAYTLSLCLPKYIKHDWLKRFTKKLNFLQKKYNFFLIGGDLSKSNKIIAFIAKTNTPILNFSKINHHRINDFWIPKFSNKNSIVIKKNKFYILRSKEKIRIPSYLAGEMVPYDTGIGDFRAHYAGFFDPGFGDPMGSYAVLEVKTNELPFLLDDNQTIARIKYEKLNKKSNIVYGNDIMSNYQHQGLKLSKHFISDE